MPKFLTIDKAVTPIASPLTLTGIRKYVGMNFTFVDLRSGDILIVSDNASEPNPFATSLLGQPVCGPAILCSPSDIA